MIDTASDDPLIVLTQPDQSVLDDAEPAPEALRVIATPDELRQAREARGWPMSQVAGRLRMQVRQIEALEAGRWEDLPGIAFVRGAIRAYARQLDRDPGPLLASVAPIDTGVDLRKAPRAPVTIAPTASFGKGPSLGRWAFALLGLIAVVTIAFYFAPRGDLQWPARWFDPEPAAETISGAGGVAVVSRPVRADSGPVEAQAPADAGPSDAAVAAATRAASELLGADTRGTTSVEPAVTRALAVAGSTGLDAEESTSRPTLSEASVAPAAPVDGAPVADAAPVTVTESAQSMSNARASRASGAAGTLAASSRAPDRGATAGAAVDTSLLMRFSAECWIEVTDSRGTRLAHGLQKPGMVLALDAAGPLSVVIGKADAVTLTRGGVPVEVVGRARDGVARLRLE